MTVLGLSAALALLASAQAGSSAAAAPEPSAQPKHLERLVIAFREICSNNRGSWDRMKQNAEQSAFGLKAVAGAGKQQITYRGFPLEISLKRWGQLGYLCTAQSVVEPGSTVADLFQRIVNSGPGFDRVAFKPTEKGVEGTFLDSGRSSRVGTQYTRMLIQISEGNEQPFPIAQIAIYSN